MQFMSQSMGWADHFILAMAPVGIITIIVSTIRVGGPSWLKAIIGRARENLAVAEADLMSSTSKEVCELWNGQEVVWCMDSSPVTEFICLLPESMEPGTNYAQLNIKTIGLLDALKEENRYLETYGELVTCILWQDSHISKDKSFWRSIRRKIQDDEQRESPNHTSPEIIIIRNTTAESPNISLNCHDQFGRRGLRVVAVVATILQLGVLIFCGFATYYPSMKYPKDDKSVQNYAFPCMATGTLTLVLGLLVCSHVIESSTEEERYKPGPGRRVRMVWLQKAQTVSDQHFGSFAIFPVEDRKIITTSRRASKLCDDVPVTMLATKASIERMASFSDFKAVIKGIDRIFGLKVIIGTFVSLCGFVVQFIGLRGVHWSASIAQLVSVLIMIGFRAWVCRGLAEPPRSIPLDSGFELDWFATTLGEIDRAPWHDRLAPLPNDETKEVFRNWTVQTGHQTSTYEISCDTEQEHGPMPENQAKGGRLSLEKKGLESQELERANNEDGDDAWLRTKGLPAKRSLRLLGQGTQALAQNLEWWMPSDGPSILKANETRQVRKDIEGHRIIGGDVHHQSITNTTGIAQESGNADAIFSENGDGEHVLLAAESYTPLKLLYAQGIFSSFMWAVAESLSGPMAGAAEIHSIDETSGADSWKSFALRNGHLSKIIQDIQNTGLGSTGDIYLSMIPPLGVENKLPHAEAIIQLAQHHAKTHERMGQLEEAGDIYLWLFQTVQVFPPESHVYVKTAGVLMLHLKYIDFIREMREFEEGYVDVAVRNFRTDSLKRHMNKLIQQDRSNSVPQRLTTLFQAQSRGLESARIQKGVSEKSKDIDLSRSLEQITSLGFTKLHYLCQGRTYQKDAISGYVKEDKDINCRDILDWTPLHYAAARSDSDNIFVMATVHQANVNALDTLDWTPLHYACLRGNAKNVVSLLRGRADVNAKGKNGIAPLHCAAMKGHKTVMSLLVEAGAAIDVLDGFQTTPLLWAASKGHKAVVEYLWPDASRKLRDDDGRTALHLATLANNPEVVELLLKQNPPAEKDAKDRNGQTPLYVAVVEDRQAIVELLIGEGADTEAKDLGGNTVLHWAVTADKENMARLLIKAGSDIEVRGADGHTILHWAVTVGNEDMVALLIELGADKEAKDPDGHTVLYWAVVI
ncbi:ankyrin repeat protein [Fusarium austroafricanum]|uniref:Ankyrin repeat protein n=1 Tax=Fusarium austroafricanum TaxID=2364996 RepID=A0A8H4KMV5_9HYPO|nr:ankyrin repeat protein [Fusarium austroafricanum]